MKIKNQFSVLKEFVFIMDFIDLCSSPEPENKSISKVSHYENKGINESGSNSNSDSDSDDSFHNRSNYQENNNNNKNNNKE